MNDNFIYVCLNKVKSKSILDVYILLWMTIFSYWTGIIAIDNVRNMMIPIVIFLAPSFWIHLPSKVIHKPKYDLLQG